MPYKIIHNGSKVTVFVQPVSGYYYYRIFCRYTANASSKVFDSEDVEGLIYATQPFGRTFTASGALTINILCYVGNSAVNPYAMGARSFNTANAATSTPYIKDGPAMACIYNGSKWVMCNAAIYTTSGWKGDKGDGE